MEKLDKKLECSKCGFRPTYNKDWKLSFENDCTSFGYKKCGWDDESNKEHLHQECPDCGYTIPVPCMDNDKVVEAEKANTWSTSGTGLMGEMKKTEPATTTAIAPVTKPATTVTPITQASVRTTFKPAKPAKCSKCPVDATEASAT